MTNDEYQQLAQAAAQKLRAAGIGVGFHNQTWEAPAGGVLTVDAVREFVDARILTPNPELQRDLGGRLAEIPFDYIKNGCFARAHIMAEVFEDHGIGNAKLLVSGRLHASNQHYPQGFSWGWHVAPLVCTDSAGAIALRVVDPSVAAPGKKAVPLAIEEWAAAIDPSKRGLTFWFARRAKYVWRGEAATFEQNLASARHTLELEAGQLGQRRLRADLLLAERPTIVEEYVLPPTRVDADDRCVLFGDMPTLFSLPEGFPIEEVERAMAAGAPMRFRCYEDSSQLLSIESIL